MRRELYKLSEWQANLLRGLLSQYISDELDVVQRAYAETVLAALDDDGKPSPATSPIKQCKDTK